MTNIPHGDPGLARGVDTETFRDIEVFLSNSPPPVTQPFKMPKVASGAAVTHPIYSVMALDANGKIHQVADSTDRTDDGCARVILAGQYTQQAAAGGAEIDCEAYIEGHFNIDGLVWDDTFDDDPKKLAAFGSFGTGDFVNPGLIRVGVNPYNRKT